MNLNRIGGQYPSTSVEQGVVDHRAPCDLKRHIAQRRPDILLCIIRAARRIDLYLQEMRERRPPIRLGLQ